MKDKERMGAIAKRAALGFSKNRVGFWWEYDSDRQREKLCGSCESEKTEGKEK